MIKAPAHGRARWEWGVVLFLWVLAVTVFGPRFMPVLAEFDAKSGTVLSAVPDAGSGTVSGMVWWDRNANGFWELDESAVDSWPVYLQAEADAPAGPIQQAFTNSSGAYTFGNLSPGFYNLWSVDSRGDTPKIRIEIGEVGTPVSRDIASLGFKSYLPHIARSDSGTN